MGGQLRRVTTCCFFRAPSGYRVWYRQVPVHVRSGFELEYYYCIDIYPLSRLVSKCEIPRLKHLVEVYPGWPWLYVVLPDAAMLLG